MNAIEFIIVVQLDIKGGVWMDYATLQGLQNLESYTLTAKYIISLVFGILLLVSMWKIFKKAGQPGWAAIVPVYNNYIFMKISWRRKWPFWSTLSAAVVAVVAALISIYSFIRGDISPLRISLGVLMLAATTFMLVMEILAYVKIAKAFRKGGGFACGLIFLPIIFLPILAFGSSRYRYRRRRRRRIAEEDN